MTGRSRSAALAVAGLALLGACSDDDDDAGETGTTTTTTSAPEATSTTAGEPSSTTTTEAPVESDPHEAAEAFMLRHFPGSNAALGDFQQGDNRSGEVQVFRPNEGGGTANLASTLLLRLDDAGEWQVIGAVNEFVTIEAPENGAEVPASPLVVSGAGRGFEATLVVRAVDDEGADVAQAVGTGGAQAEPVPYETELDLTGAAGDLVIIVSGGVGLDNDTGEFSAVRVTVAG